MKKVNKLGISETNIPLPSNVHQRVKIYCAVNGLKIKHFLTAIIEKELKGKEKY